MDERSNFVDIGNFLTFLCHKTDSMADIHLIDKKLLIKVVTHKLS